MQFINSISSFYINATVQEIDNILTKKAALRSIWVIPSVPGVSWRLAASINSPTLLLGEYVSSETIFRPFANVETYKQNNEGCSKLLTSQFALQQKFVFIMEKKVSQQQTNFQNPLTLLKSLQPASLTKDNLPPIQKTWRWMCACILSISDNPTLHNLEPLKKERFDHNLLSSWHILSTVQTNPSQSFKSEYSGKGDDFQHPH